MRLQDQPENIQRASLKKQKGETAVALPVKKRKIIMATNRELANEHRYRRLWITIKNLMGKDGFSRRKFVDFCINCFRDKNETVECQWPGGMTYVLPDWDILFPDSDCRWLSDYLEECNGLPKRRSPMYSRLRIFDAVIQMCWPNIARRIRE